MAAAAPSLGGEVECNRLVFCGFCGAAVKHFHINSYLVYCCFLSVVRAML